MKGERAKAEVESVETPCVCPYCNLAHELASGIGPSQGMRPFSGALSVCIGCGKASVFTDDLKLRKPTRDEAIQIAQNPVVTAAAIYIAGAKR